MNFSLLWDVYNQLHEAVDSEFLFQSNTDEFEGDEGDAFTNEDGDVRLPLNHLNQCEFGADGVPAARVITEGEVDCLCSYAPFDLLTSLNRSAHIHQAQRARRRYDYLHIFLLHSNSTHNLHYTDGNLRVDFTSDEDEMY
jgi:hypothetical protein